MLNATATWRYLKNRACSPSGLARFYLMVALLGALLLAVLTPPFQVHNEPQHFYRAYAYSEGILRPQVKDNTVGSLLPTSLQELAVHFLGTTDLHPRPGMAAQPLRATLERWSVPLAPERRSFVTFTGAAPYAPLAYTPRSPPWPAGARWACSISHESPIAYARSW